MENRGGYAYGIWFLLTSRDYIPFDLQHKLHVTLISNIECRRKAQKLYTRLLKENLDFPQVLHSSDFETQKFLGEPMSAVGWKIDIQHWDSLKVLVKELLPQGNVPDIPHVSLQYYRSKDFSMCDYYLKDVSFSTSLVLVDMNDPDPANWKTIH
jgi:hypothetical protein